MKSCQKCKTYKDCTGHYYTVHTESGKQNVEWYSYAEIRFCIHQVMWVLLNQGELEMGSWPKEPVSSGYVDSIIRTTRVKRDAYFVDAAIILGEILYRLACAGKDGEILEGHILLGKPLTSNDTATLHYIKGWRRKELGYTLWHRQNNYRKKINN